MLNLMFFFDCGGKFVMQVGVVALLGVMMFWAGRKYGFTANEEETEEYSDG